MKKIIAVLSFFWTSVVFSGTWGFGAQVLYVKPDLDVINVRGTTSGFSTQGYVLFNPDFSWGFAFDGQYLFDDNLNDITLSVYHVAETTRRQPGTFNGREGNTISSAQLQIEPDWTAVNVMWGHSSDIDKFKWFKMDIGLQFMRLTLDEDDRSLVFEGSGTTLLRTIIDRTFNGVGPRIGIRLTHQWPKALAVYGQAYTTILAGTRGSTTRYPSGVTPDRTLSSFAIVPELEGKLGASFFKSLGQSTLVFDLGWLWLDYFSAAVTDGYNFVLNVNTQPSYSRFGLQGPYLGVKWVGDLGLA